VVDVSAQHDCDPIVGSSVGEQRGCLLSDRVAAAVGGGYWCSLR
jgi:hypothetical protein